ncbi:MAG: ATP-binding protein [Fusobacterium perfoetens]|uniref:AAA family ATPase n=1 Tax=Fusobacterium perfoetens TaxID=852 RepID=UPI0023F45715|nr:AAA family ATPase [Fusobacterium perfoetens]MCI6153387.1 ATP-binding protein [Fusobacterium perfoetens]MDY3238470.1 AAA family ATPase [Fusobacterium perfoetens]
MQIEKLYIKKFKNFKNFEIEFGKENTYDIIIGENGSGKSNLFEAIIEIFLFLLEKSKDNYFKFEFKIKYKLEDKIIEVEYEDNNILYKINEIEQKNKKKLPKNLLPQTLMLYYSGQNERINNYILEYENKYRGKNKKSIIKQDKKLRNIFGILKEHKSILLLLLLMYKENENFNKILDEIKIEKNFVEGKMILKTPFYLKKKQAIMSIYDENRFWKIKGDIEKKLLELTAGNKGEAGTGNEGFFASSQNFYITLDMQVLENLSKKYNIYEMFSFFDDLRVIEMLEKIELKVKKNEEVFFDYNLSEGENQYIIFNTITEVFKDKECIFLLDEPDSFLHPKWQERLIEAIQNKTNSKNQILMSSHNLTTVARYAKQPFLLRKNKKIIRAKIDYAISELSSNLAKIDRRDNTSTILESYKLEETPIILTEGKTDCNIIRKAWQVLKDTEPPFKLIPLFSDEFLQRTLISDEIKNNCNEKPIIGIFDFDEAFDFWKKITQKDYMEIIENNPYNGLTCKNINKRIYAMLLPVNEKVENLVIKDKKTNKTFEKESRLSIELLFYGTDETKDYFKLESCVGGKRLEFYNKGQKNKFSTECISKFSKDSFQNFIPLINKIEQIINGEI